MTDELHGSLSDRLLRRVNLLEGWLERTQSRMSLLPLRLLGYASIVLLLLTSNLIAVIRWPFAALFRPRPVAVGPTEDEFAGLRGGKPLDADEQTLRRMIACGRPVLVDFWAAWCGPCLMMNPALERLAAELGDACIVAKVDTVRHSALAGEYGVRGLPALVVFRDGMEIARHAGALSYGELREWILKAGVSAPAEESRV
ncbi:thioredoxin family protein [Lentisalinibacter orientalis]|uniref:thioredoxin family protein n=1 Tax=Lentisalinibacter orientalis TaxID=2992241 RepID=UPI00386572E6